MNPLNELDSEADRVYRRAIRVCRRRFDVWTDDDYLEAINYSVGFAFSRPAIRGATISTFAIRIAINMCYAVRRAIRERCFLTVNRDGEIHIPDYPQRRPKPIRLSLSDTDFLNLLATHGRTLACTLLCLTRTQLRRKLDSIACVILSKKDD